MVKRLLLELIEWIYKKKCYFCGCSKENSKMCSKCLEEIEYNDYSTSRNILNCKVFCSNSYSETIQKLIRAVKYHQKAELAYYQAKIMADYWKKLDISKDIFQVIPVPMYITREKSRKYNHMDLVGEEFCKITGYTFNKELVKRIKDTRPQYKLKRSERMENLNQAFIIDKSKLLEKPILLLDDICTTGATFESIISELKSNGIYDIIGFATATPIIEEVLF